MGNDFFDSYTEGKITAVALITAAVLCVLILFRIDLGLVPGGEGATLPGTWTTMDGSGEEQEVSLPYTGMVPDTSLVLSQILSEGYEGMNISVEGDNVSATFELDGARLPGTDSAAVPGYGKGTVLRMYLSSVNSSLPVTVRSVKADSPDRMMNTRVRNAFAGSIPCVIIGGCMIILLLLAILDMIAKRENTFGYTAYSFVTWLSYSMATDIPATFFGNSEIFNSLHILLLSVTPVTLIYAAPSALTPVIDAVVLVLSIISIGLGAVSGIFLPSISAWSVIFSCVLLAMISILRAATLFVGPRRRILTIEAVWLTLTICVSILYITSVIRANSTPYISITLSIVSLMVWRLSSFIADYREATERAEREALELAEAKGAFLASMSHEIRTPVNAILGMGNMILKESDDEEINSYASDIVMAGEGLLSIVNDVLDLSKMEAGKMEAIPVDYDTAGMFHGALTLISMKAEDKRLELQVDITPSIPRNLHGDDRRIKQVLVNLLSNAVKYTESGTVGLRAFWEPGSGNTGTLTCEVWDTGIGIREEDMPGLFSEYERLDETLHRHTEGTGLGMAITAGFLSLMDSRLAVRSEYGKGSVFRFSVEQGIVDPEPVGDFASQHRVKKPTGAAVISLTAPGAEIMVVDDNEMNRKVICSLLKDTGIKITEARSGNECLAYLFEGKGDNLSLILLDSMMPGMSGEETLQKIRTSGIPAANIPVFALTADAVQGAEDKYLQAGFDGYLSKPVDPAELGKVLYSYLPQDIVHNTTPARQTARHEALNVPGVDQVILISRFPDTASQKEAFKNFYRGAGIEWKKMKTLISRISTLEGIKAYQIEVHAMKSMAGTIGATSLQQSALALENAAKAGDVNAIASLHPAFMNNWRSFAEGMVKTLGYKRREKKAADRSLIIQTAKQISEALEEMDTDKADALMDSLISYQFSPEDKTLVEKLKEAVDNLDTYNIFGIINS